MQPTSQGKKTDRPKVVSHNEWLAARKEFLAKEKEFTHLRDELSRQRRELPWEKVEKPYVFEGPNGKETLADLFGGRSQLIVYHFMLGPGWKEGCPSCSYLSDHFDGATIHLANRDVTLAVISRAPSAEIEAFKKRMGWRFKWVSSFGSDFNSDYQVSSTKEEIAGGKVYYNYEPGEFPNRGAARCQRVLQGRVRRASSTPIPLTRVASIFWSERTIFSTSRPRAATKTAWRSQWRGFATTISTTKVTSWTVRRSTCHPRLRMPPAARMSTTPECSC